MTVVPRPGALSTSNSPPCRFDDSIGNAHAKSGPFLPSSGKEGVEDSAADFLVHANARIRDGDGCVGPSQIRVHLDDGRLRGIASTALKMMFISTSRSSDGFAETGGRRPRFALSSISMPRSTG